MKILNETIQQLELDLDGEQLCGIVNFASQLEISKRTRRTFSPEFRLKTAQLVVDQGYTHDEADKATGVDFSTIGKWVKQLQQER
jgi:hypothetical protein